MDRFLNIQLSEIFPLRTVFAARHSDVLQPSIKSELTAGFDHLISLQVVAFHVPSALSTEFQKWIDSACKFTARRISEIVIGGPRGK